MTEIKFAFAPPPRPALPIDGRNDLFPVRRIYCVGRNYAEHVREMGGDERQAPFFFQKPGDAAVPSGTIINYPSVTKDFQHEVELVLAIGTGGVDIAEVDAAKHVFAVGVGLDLTRRDVQVEARKAGRPWEIGKAFDHSAPVGPLLPTDGAPLPERGVIALSVNGETRQKGNLAEMIWKCSEVVSQLSRQYSLQPGDLIMTGTPAGVGTLMPGDAVVGTIDGLAPLRITIG
jgi:fumarylpyruvate hydrolase